MENLDTNAATLRISLSGIRGKVPEGLNVTVAFNFASSFATYLGEGKIGVCVDGRWSGTMLSYAVNASISACGLDVYNLCVVPTPFLQFLIGKGIFDAGISITGGHNPQDWNALLLLNEKGAYLDSIEGNEVFNIYHSREFSKASWNEIGEIKEYRPDWSLYLKAMEKFVNAEEIRKARFKIVVDPCQGAGSVLIKDFADFFNLKILTINSEVGGKFPHDPEPNLENARQVAAVMEAVSYDAGFLLNSDASRLSLITEKGKALSEEYTFPLVALSFLEKHRSSIVTTVATSRMIEHVAEKFGVSVMRTRVGQSYVVHTMEATGAEIGGEGSGSICIKEFSKGYDAFFSIALILDLMATKGKTLSELASCLPEYHIKKLKFPMPVDRIYRLVHHLKETYSSENPNLEDGVRVERKKGWFNIRPSTTEFILRAIIEGESPGALEELVEEVTEKIWSFQ